MKDDAQLIKDLISAGDEMVAIADQLGQPMAGNYFAMAVDVLRAHLELAASAGVSIVQSRPDDNFSATRELYIADARIAGIIDPLDQIARFKRSDPS